MTRPVFKYPITFLDNTFTGSSSTEVEVAITFDGTPGSVWLMTANSGQLYWTTATGATGSQNTDILSKLSLAVEALFVSSVLDVTIDPATQKLILSGNAPFTLQFDDAATFNLDAGIFGFPQTSIASSGWVLTSSFIPKGTWFPSRNPFPDTYEMPEFYSETTTCVSGRSRTIVWNSGSFKRRMMTFQYEPRHNTIAAFAGTEQGPSGTYQSMFDAMFRGHPIRYYTSSYDVASDTFRTFKNDDQKPSWKAFGDNQALYTIPVNLKGSATGED